MAESAVPRTPSPVIHHSKTFTSLTPPPTNQTKRYSAPQPRQRTNRIPTLEEARSYSAAECQSLVLDLLPLLGEARMELAHTKLQLQLLSISSNEAAQRAQIEHEMTRREAEVLRAGSPILRGRSATMQDHSPFYQVQRQLEIAIEAGNGLESENALLKHKLRKAKRVIKHLNGQKAQLGEDNRLLRERIKQNREHVDAKSSTNPSPAIFTPRIRNARRPSPSAPLIAPQAQNALDALLMADQILSADPSSMPATPSPLHPRHRAQGHVRGVQSLSSLPSTPTRVRRMSANTLLATPANRIIHQGHDTARYTAPAGVILRGEKRMLEREDRDGTISATDDEALTDDDQITTSRASRVAGGMLLKNVAEHTGNTNATGAQYPWMTMGRSSAIDDEQSERPRKKAKSIQSKANVGLGIKPWE